MRDKLAIVLLSVCCTLLAVNLIALWSESPVVHGQAAGSGAQSESGEFVLATSATQNEPVVFVFKVGTQHLAAYTARSGQGLRVLGVRQITWDLNLAEVRKHFSVKEAKKAKPKPSAK